VSVRSDARDMPFSLSKIQMEHGANQYFVPSTRALARIQKFALPCPSPVRTRSEVDSRLAEPSAGPEFFEAMVEN